MTFKSKTIAGFGTAVFIMALVCVVSYRSMVRSSVDRQWVTHTHQVIEKLDEVQGNITDAETGQRGYLLTGEQPYLDPYKNALDHVHENLRELRELTSDNPVEQRALDLLNPVIAQKLQELQDRIDERNRSGLAQTIAGVRAGTGIQDMQEIRSRIAQMRGEESGLLARRLQESEASARTTRAVIVIGDGLGLLFLCLAGIVVRQEIEQRKRAEENVRELNAGLEQRVAERTLELAERAKDLTRSNSELQQFAYVASHDLQEPLRMVASFTQLLAKRYREKLDDDARGFINYAVDGATRMQTLISDLLTYSRVGTQGKPLEPTACDEVLDRVLRNLKFAIEESGAKVTREPLPVVMADAQQLGQLFQNLISNAIKFHGETPPHVDISAKSSGGIWTFSVRDNGIGISPEHSERIFIIFQRLHTRTEYTGTGIGLAVCKKVAERHGGRIWVESAAEGGTVFHFTIPVTQIQKTLGSEKYEFGNAAAAR